MSLKVSDYKEQTTEIKINLKMIRRINVKGDVVGFRISNLQRIIV